MIKIQNYLKDLTQIRIKNTGSFTRLLIISKLVKQLIKFLLFLVLLHSINKMEMIIVSKKCILKITDMISEKDLIKFQELDLMEPILPVSEKSKNKLYLCWRNSDGVECKMIGPETKCFCNHRFKQHQYLNSQTKRPYCKVPKCKCKCKCFEYIPAHGAYDFKCLCKHSYKQHDMKTRKCTRENCKNCTGFKSAWTCSCGSKYIDHVTVIETYEERKKRGKTVNDMVRLNNQLNSAIQQKSLLKGIKQDPQARLKKKKESFGLKIKGKIQETQDDDIQEYFITKKRL